MTTHIIAQNADPDPSMHIFYFGILVGILFGFIISAIARKFTIKRTKE